MQETAHVVCPATAWTDHPSLLAGRSRRVARPFCRLLLHKDALLKLLTAVLELSCCFFAGAAAGPLSPPAAVTAGLGAAGLLKGHSATEE